MIRPAWQSKSFGSLPQMNDAFAIVSVAATVCIMAFSTLIGPAAIVLLYVLWLPFALSHWGQRPRQSLQNNLLPAIYIVVCIASVLWSDYRLVTARASLEAASMMLCALTIPQVARLEAFIKGVNLGVVLILVATLISGKYGVDCFSGTYSLIGLFGSKNQVGLFAEIGVLSSLVYLFSKNGFGGKLLFVPLPLGLSLVCLYLSQSATALASLALVLILCFGIGIVIRLPKNLRSPAMGITVLFVVITIAAGFILGWQKFGLDLLGRNSTLTGRTYLWAEGIKTGMEHPFLGDGFAAFWVPGQQQAEKYWFEFGVFIRSGFHFHNMFVEGFIELGFVGAMLLALLYVSNAFASLRYNMRHGLDMTGFFALGLTLMFTIRAFVEVDILGSFGIGELLFFTITPYLNRRLAKTGVVDLPGEAKRSPPYVLKWARP